MPPFYIRQLMELFYVMPSCHGNTFRIADPLWGESTDQSEFSHHNGPVNAEPLCFLFCQPNQAVERTIELPIIIDVITPCNVTVIYKYSLTSTPETSWNFNAKHRFMCSLRLFHSYINNSGLANSNKIWRLFKNMVACEGVIAIGTWESVVCHI